VNWKMLDCSAGRRSALKSASAVSVLGLFAAVGLVLPGVARAQAGWNKEAFAAKRVADVLKAFNAGSVAKTTAVEWGATPDIAENGAVVPIEFTSRIPNTRSVAILLEKNPNTLAAKFEFPPGTDPVISIRLKIANSSNVHTLIRTADDKFFIATREVKVTQGACAG
jgi:sulfur-oxidizing protein SoxY